MADLEVPLLKHSPAERRVKTYPQCPGCKAALLAREGAPPPYTNLLFVSCVVLCNALPISSLYPFLYFMVKDFKIAAHDEDIGFYAGFIGSAFMFGRFLTSIQCGMIADKYGRKPVMVVSLCAVVVFNLVFGASTNFWMALISRLVLGFFNGSLGPVKAYASEICSDEHQAVGVTAVSTAWGLGLIVGPAIGGYLSQPALKYPALFPPGSLFDRFPYLLPSLTTSAVAFVGVFITLHLPETIHVHKEEESVLVGDTDEEKAHEESVLVEGIDSEEKVQDEFAQKVSKSSWFITSNWPLLAAIAVYCLWSMHDMAYTEIFSLWAVSPKEAGGLGFTTSDVGNVLAASGASLMLFQPLLFPPLARRLGAISITRVAMVLSLPLLAAYPAIAGMTGAPLWAAVLFTSVSKNLLSGAAMGGTFLLINNSVKPSQRGRANGLSVSVVSLFKAVGPGAGGAIFAWAQSRHSNILPGNEIVFFFLGLVALVGIILTADPILPTSLNRTRHENDDDDVKTNELTN